MAGQHGYWGRISAARIGRRRALGIVGAGTVAAYLAACAG